MRRVLLSTDAVGGVWRYSLELAAGLAGLGCETTLAVLGPSPTGRQYAEAAAVPGLRMVVTGQSLDWTADSAALVHAATGSLGDLAAAERVDTVQLHAPALVGSVDWPVPVIVAAHSCVGTWWRAVHGGALPADLAWRASAARDGLAGADAIIAPSHSFAADLRACYGVERRVHIVPNGRRPVAGCGPRQKVVLTAGRLWDEGKGVATLDAAARLIAQTVYAAGPVAGPNGAAASTPYLKLLGTLDEAALADWYARAAVFASVSRYEPFGLAVLEAAQAGCALVLSDIATFRELWDGAAVFVPPDDPVALASALSALLLEPKAAERQGDMARQRSTRFDPDRMAAATWDVHSAVLAGQAI